MKKIYKISIILFIFITIISMACKVEAKDIWSIGAAFIDRGSKDVGTLEEDQALLQKLGIDTKEKFEELIDFLWGIGLLVIFITTVVLGIKYMFVLPDEKSRLKQATTPYIVGVIIIFGALTIWKLIIVILEGSL